LSFSKFISPVSPQSIAMGLAYASTGIFRSVTPLVGKYQVHVLCVLVSYPDCFSGTEATTKVRIVSTSLDVAESYAIEVACLALGVCTISVCGRV